MYDERERCLELLGMKPGASVQEIKAAYRDLAKVWHPDRFAHDPRLQEKAQDKLKEINEAYEALISGRYTRSAGNARPSTEPPASHTPQPRSQNNAGKYLWPMMILLACVAAIVFFVSTRPLRSDRSDDGQLSVKASQPASEDVAERDEAALNRKEKKIVEKQKASTAASSTGPIESQAPLRALPTVNVMIDPTTGQLATANCPIKSSMTYVGGQEPRGSCSANHRPLDSTAESQPDSKKKSRLKSVVNRMAAPARWLKDKVNEPY